jgi:hypothetical protein
MGWREKCIEYPAVMFGSSLRKARERATKKGIPFDLTKEYIMNLFEEQEGRCYYSDIKLNIVKVDKTRVHDPFKMSLDCIDPNLGYIKGNVAWCAYCVNSLKLKMPVENMISICRQIVKKADRKNGL